MGYKVRVTRAVRCFKEEPKTRRVLKALETMPHLTTHLAANIDWSSLTALPGSFVKSRLQQIHSDLFFSVRIGGQESLLYLLFEHQSTVDVAMPPRLLGYVTEILTQHHKHYGFPLPAVLSFVLHQGTDRWSVSTPSEPFSSLRSAIQARLTVSRSLVKKQQMKKAEPRGSALGNRVAA